MPDQLSGSIGCANLSHPKLTAGAKGTPRRKIDFQQLFALHCPPLFVGERAENFLARSVDDFAGGRPGEATVDRDGNPAGLIANRDGMSQFRGRYGGVENVEFLIVRGGQPDFPFVRRQRDAVARAAVTFDWGRRARNLDGLFVF
jgi:hypothetical protein